MKRNTRYTWMAIFFDHSRGLSRARWATRDRIKSDDFYGDGLFWRLSVIWWRQARRRVFREVMEGSR